METENLQKEVKVLKADDIPTLQAQLKDLKLKLDAMVTLFHMLRKTVGNKHKNERHMDPPKAGDNGIYNKDGIPLNSQYIGYTQSSEYPYILVVDTEGLYHVGHNTFTSLSASAEFVSGVRRSGWTFWKLLDGRTIKEVYRDKK